MYNKGMTSKEVLEDLLICPITQNKLQLLTSGLLKTQDHEIYYPIKDGIIYLLPQAKQAEQTKQDVQSFYDNLGWKKEGDVYKDAKDSEDLRTVSKQYIEECHQRVKTHLPIQGQYLLDIACGPLQYPTYLTYSDNFDYRICADISLTALKEAQKKLGDKGIYILCDVTALPIEANKIDAVVSLHTLYHVPADQQAKGFAELHRVLKPGGKSVIVYSWGQRSILMNVTMFPFKALSFLRRKLISKYAKQELYFYTHSYRWFCEEIKEKYNTSLFSWRSVNVPFLKVFIHPFLGGGTFLKMIAWLENTFPEQMGRIGAYPMLVSTKK